MPHVTELIRLLRAIASRGDSQNLEELERLLMKISKSRDHCSIEVDYDGNEFHWKITQRNITAAEWMPRKGPVDSRNQNR